MKRIVLLLVCLLAALGLTACHVDNDPWPIDGALPVSAPDVTDLPKATDAPARPTAAPQQPAVTQSPTAVPGGEEDPGING